MGDTFVANPFKIAFVITSGTPFWTILGAKRKLLRSLGVPLTMQVSALSPKGVCYRAGSPCFGSAPFKCFIRNHVQTLATRACLCSHTTKGGIWTDAGDAMSALSPQSPVLCIAEVSLCVFAVTLCPFMSKINKNIFI